MSKLEYAIKRFNRVQQRIAEACTKANRNPKSVTLIGASKLQSAELITAFHEAGLRHVGENYLQEAIVKKSDLANQAEMNSLEWHFIGSIQSNKTKLITENFTWVHGVDRLKIAQRLAKQSQGQHHTSTPIKLLVQINPDGETSKAGVSLADASELANEIAQLDGADLKGFMMIPQARPDQASQRAVFAQAYECLTATNQRYGLGMTELSMGMSGDLEAAILEGSTLIRVGTDLFGARQ